jgi:adenylate cyclase
MTEQRRLAAILVADVVGYSRLMGSDEAGTLAQLEALRAEIIQPNIAKHAGRLFKSVGDGFLIEFASAVQAVSCAKAIQDANGEGRLPLRIGIHVGDVVVQGDDLMGDGVNVAARVEGIAEPGGIAITRAVHEQVRDKVDLGFLDKGEIELKNIQRPVQVFVIGVAKVSNQATHLPLPDKPSIAVLPFQNMSGDPEQEYFADGMVEDIITALSRFKSLFVIVRNSSFTYKGKAVEVQQVGRELGVRYVLEGSVRRSGGKVRITGQLIDSQTGAHLWANRFDAALADVFELQDEVTSNVVGAIAPTIDRAEIERARRKPAENLSAYDLYLRVLSHMWTATREELPKAIKLLRQSVSLDGRSAPALAALAWCLIMAPAVGANMSGNTTGEALDLSRQAVEQDSGDDFAQAIYGQALTLIVGDCAQGRLHAEEAVRLNPSSAFAWSAMGFVGNLAGDFEAAIDSFQLALRLSPSDTFLYWWMTGLAAAQFALRRYEDAVASARSAVQRHPSFGSAHRLLAASLALAGKLDEARDVTRRRDRVQTTTLREIGALRLFRQDEVMNRYLAAQRLCGVAE